MIRREKTVNRFRATAAGVLLLLLMTACGYRLEGGGLVHPGVSRVGVTVFANRTAYTQAGIDFTNELIREIQDRTDTQVAAPEQAAYLIQGTVRSITFATLSRSSTETVTERRVTAVVDVQLLSPDKKTLWSVSNFSTFESFAVGADSIDDAANIRKALEIISERIAERIVGQMSADF
jgi:outer membrane lipopolysaccharide assembly protein LptE/RlpB